MNEPVHTVKAGMGAVPYEAGVAFRVWAPHADRLDLMGTFNDWTEVLGSERLEGAVLDRLTHRCHIIETTGESYCLQDAKRRRGRQPLRTGDQSRNNFLFGVLGFGEGWHNNHHAFPTSARFGLRWWQIDLGYWFICILTLLGLASRVRQHK